MTSGPHAGETGTVQLSTPQDPKREDSEWVAVIILDSGMKEIQCFLHDIQVCAMTCG